MNILTSDGSLDNLDRLSDPSFKVDDQSNPVVFVPTIVLLIPIVRSIPHLYRWRIQSRIYRWYRALLVLERELINEPESKKRRDLLQRLDEIETAVNKMKVPAFFANQFYSLRGHIDFVRQMMSDKPPQ